MHRLLIVAATAAILAVTTAAPVLADEDQSQYPPCTRTLQDHCREVGHQAHNYPRHHHPRH